MLRHLVLTLLAAAPLCAAQVQVTLTDGHIIEGELLKEDDTSITVQQRMAGRGGGMKATMTYLRTQIDKIEPVVDAATRYADLAAETPDTATAQLGLAEWCRDHDLHDQAVERAKHVLVLDSTHAKAKDLLNGLGLYELDGAWLSEADYCEKTGTVRYKDRFLTPAEREIAKAKDAAETSAKAAKNAADQAENRSERLADDISSVDKQIAALEDSKANVEKDVTSAAATQDRYAAFERDYKAAQNKADNENKKNGKVSQGTQNEVDKAQARYDKERANSREANRTKESATARLASLDKKIATLREKRQKLSEDKTASDKAAADKQIAADKAAAEAKAAADAAPATVPAP